MSQSHDLHRALLRPAIIHTLRAAGFHSTKPSVLDTLVNMAERHIMLLASTTAQHAYSSHNDPVPTITDVRMALSDCGVLVPLLDPAEESWKEKMRRPLAEIAQQTGEKGGEQRVAGVKRKRDEEDTRDVKAFTDWYDSAQHREIKRVAGMIKEDQGLVVGVGGGVMHGEDFLATLKKKHGKVGDETRLQGTVLGLPADDRECVVEGGPVQHLRDWKPKFEERKVPQVRTAEKGKAGDDIAPERPAETSTTTTDTPMREVTAAG